MHICNNIRLFHEYTPTATTLAGVGGKGISPGRGKITLQLALEDGRVGAILNIEDAWYMPDCPVNLVSRDRLERVGLYEDSYDRVLYERLTDGSRKVIAHAPKPSTNVVLAIVGMESPAIRILLAETHDDVFQWPERYAYHASGPE